MKPKIKLTVDATGALKIETFNMPKCTEATEKIAKEIGEITIMSTKDQHDQEVVAHEYVRTS